MNDWMDRELDKITPPLAPDFADLAERLAERLLSHLCHYHDSHKHAGYRMDCPNSQCASDRALLADHERAKKEAKP